MRRTATLRSWSAILLLSILTTLLPSAVPQVVAAPAAAMSLPALPLIPATRPLPAPSVRPPDSFRPARSAIAEATTATQASRQIAAPLAFVTNRGQTDARVRYQVDQGGGTLFLTPNQLVYAIPNYTDIPSRGHGVHTRLLTDTVPLTMTFSVVRQQFVGAGTATLQALKPLAGTANYLIGNDPSRWRTQIDTYDGVQYQQLYAGIDLMISGASGQLKSTYTIAPGADPGLIRWRYAGAQDVAIDSDGALVVQVPPRGPRATQVLTITEQAPLAWQEIAGQRVPVMARYALRNSKTVQFALGTYDHAYPLIIDPTLTYSTYLGGTGDDNGETIAVDADGYIYVAGLTGSANFPTSNPLQTENHGFGDIFITKLSPDGSSIVYSTYLGGSASDSVGQITVDSNGNAYLTGRTASKKLSEKGL